MNIAGSDARFVPYRAPFVYSHDVPHSARHRPLIFKEPYSRMLNAAIVTVYGVAFHRFVFQGVHMLMGFSSSDEGVGRGWHPDEVKMNRLVFIGRNLDRNQLTNSFLECIVDDAEREAAKKENAEARRARIAAKSQEVAVAASSEAAVAASSNDGSGGLL